MKSELLSPVGDFECLKAAVQNGANSVYLGASSFSARAKATNFNKTELKEAIRYAKLRNVSVHLALNTLIKNEEFQDAVKLAIEAYNMGVDAIIIQDFGLAKYLIKHYPQIPLHASTQMTIHNLDGVEKLKDLGYSRVVLARELNIDEIKHIRESVPNIELEVFVHGALCISYSGECLLSSMIGGRSGNRGLCAQPCRLPYKLVDKDDTLLDEGYLMSPKDTLGISYLPELIRMGINSFKIEGRMKTPYYVACVTRVYRKYIDYVEANLDKSDLELKRHINDMLNVKNEETGLSDLEELLQVFNRGNFGTGHLSPEPNRDLIFKEKPNNMGIFLGEVRNFNPNKGHISLKLEDTLSIGDRVQINNDSYTVSELMIDNKNYESKPKGTVVKIGRMKGDLREGQKVYRIESNALNKFLSPTFKEDKEFKKIKLNAEIKVTKGSPVSLRIWSNEGFYDGLEYRITTTIVPEESINKPLTKEDLIKQFSKTGNTEFEFENIDVILDDNLFIPKISTLNEIRRTALTGLENLVMKHHTHNLEYTDYFSFEDVKKDVPYQKKIAVTLHNMELAFDYETLEHVDRFYIPYRLFFDNRYFTRIANLSMERDVYIYMPIALKDENLEKFPTMLEKILQKVRIKGFVVSNIAQIKYVQGYNLDVIANYSFNIYNNFSIKELNYMKVNTITLSPELSEFDIQNLISKADCKIETIVYGKTPVMTNNYCYLGKTNKCYHECDRKCQKYNFYYLKDRIGAKFYIIPDKFSHTTTIFNSKITSILYNNIDPDSIRIDLTDEPQESLQDIITKVYQRERLEGKEYTNGHF